MIDATTMAALAAAILNLIPIRLALSQQSQDMRRAGEMLFT
ncbi:hypothetical protein [Xanthomonas vasicola]|nr:hypothetical protein [Xanthomonas vasicola]MDO6947857.1 hypothetical protein [Xanthomonas vasicola]MDO6959864.1 hypothetical protein [Xanthomonas vasicola]